MFRFKFFTFILSGLTILLVPGCIIDFDNDDFDCIRGEGSIVTRTLNLESFNEVSLDGSSDVYVTQGPVQEVVVEGQANIIDRLEKDVNGNSWSIDFDGCIRDHRDLKIYITIPEIRKLSIRGSGNIIGQNLFLVNDIDLNISGSGKIDLALDADDIVLRNSGSGEIFLEGICDLLDVEISGSGDFYGFDLEARAVTVDIDGSGDVRVFATEFLDVHINGSGDVLYKGHPSINADINGSGRLIDAN